MRLRNQVLAAGIILGALTASAEFEVCNRTPDEVRYIMGSYIVRSMDGQEQFEFRAAGHYPLPAGKCHTVDGSGQRRLWFRAHNAKGQRWIGGSEAIRLRLFCVDPVNPFNNDDAAFPSIHQDASLCASRKGTLTELFEVLGERPRHKLEFISSPASSDASDSPDLSDPSVGPGFSTEPPQS